MPQAMNEHMPRWTYRHINMNVSSREGISPPGKLKKAILDFVNSNYRRYSKIPSDPIQRSLYHVSPIYGISVSAIPWKCGNALKNTGWHPLEYWSQTGQRSGVCRLKYCRPWDPSSRPTSCPTCSNAKFIVLGSLQQLTKSTITSLNGNNTQMEVSISMTVQLDENLN